ncbi:snRNA-activating protein complex subunit 1 isoform X2 [Pseudomyrmex gracilis]|uniref:snRNA-activating protein complex subunit 1 isoform X2 n=1 Tax=Pseudomyrmex gracilis TaxID=219809 RepID=UPI0009958BA3|nr:snRNA-activating protein complex subunit 1 isoform X2 [Pseudomyrmex gracilis]
MFSTTQQIKLREAFRADCQALITRFELSYNTHFQNFCELWREMQFVLVFAYHPSEVYLLTFCEDALSVTKQFLVNATNLKERIAALYLMYSVYYKMPTKQLKFRMTLSDWNCLMELRSQVNKEDFLDANYIICKLIVDHAFHFCIADNVYGMENYFGKRAEKPTLDIKVMPEVKELAEPEKLLSTISKLSKIYEEKKNILYDTDGDSLQLYNATMIDDVIDNIRKVQTDTDIKDDTAQSNKPTSALNEGGQKNQKRILSLHE